MKKYGKTIGLIIVIVIASIVWLLHTKAKSPEKLFKKTIKNYNQEISKTSEKISLNNYIPKLRYIADKRPKSKWADDAQRVLAELLINYPEESIFEYRKFIKNFPDSVIEEWTIENTIFFPKFINKIPPVVEAQSQIAFTYYRRLENHQKAIEESQKVIDFFPDITPANRDAFGLVVTHYHTIAKSYKALGDLKKAEETYQTIIDRFPNTKAAQIAQDRIKELKSQL